MDVAHVILQYRLMSKTICEMDIINLHEGTLGSKYYQGSDTLEKVAWILTIRPILTVLKPTTRYHLYDCKFYCESSLPGLPDNFT